LEELLEINKKEKERLKVVILLREGKKSCISATFYWNTSSTADTSTHRKDGEKSLISN